jgi:spore coat polysaccharide biosynthesis protein SpsF
MKVGFVITGRMKSTRLEKKLTLKILDREVIAWMIDRAKLYFKDSEIVIATSENPQDDVLEEIANRENIKIFRGHEEDVVLRLYNAAKENDFDYFINITADCPLFGFDYIKDIFELQKAKNADLVTSLDFPHGIFTYGIKTEAFGRVIELKKTDNTEVWGDYFYKNPDKFVVEKLLPSSNQKREGYRLTLDYPEDFTFFETVYKHFGKDTYKTSSDDIIRFLDDNPEVVAINNDCKAKYDKRWEAQRVSNIEKK